MDYRGMIKNNDIKGIRKLISTGWNPTIRDNYPVYLAVKYRRSKILKILLVNDMVDPSDVENDALICALHDYSNYYKNKTIIKLLLADSRVRGKIKEGDYIKYPILKTLMRPYKIEALKL